MAKIRALFAAGGTGGHIYPAVAVAKELAARHGDTEILFVGSKRGMENQIVPAEGFKLVTLDLTYFPRRPSVEQLKTAYRAAKAMFEAARILKRFAPDVVMGTGGYAAGSMLFAASLLGYPTIIHEQNAYPSLTNRWLGRFVDTVAVSHEAARKHFSSSKVIVTGNPLRPAILSVERMGARERLGLRPTDQVLVAVGGSGGAFRLNEAISGAYEDLLQQGLTVYHVTGKKYYTEVKNKAGNIGNEKLKILDYASNMPDLLAAADLVVSRSGSTTAELAVLGKPAILIPSPIAANDHQLFNAKVMEEAGAAVIITEDILTKPLLLKTITGLFSSPNRLVEMGHKSKGVSFPNATSHLCSLAEKLTVNKPSFT